MNWLDEFRREEETARRAVRANLPGLLQLWRATTTDGGTVGTDIDIILRVEPEVRVRVEVAYLPKGVPMNDGEAWTVAQGVPLLAVIIPQPETTCDELRRTRMALVQAGTPIVWVVNSHFKEVTVIRPGRRDELLSEGDDLAGDPELPGFRVPVARLFE
jgi:Uma2 family endonuclease